MASADVQQIRDLFSVMWADEFKGDPASTIAALAPDAVHYRAGGGAMAVWRPVWVAYGTGGSIELRCPFALPG